MNSHPPSPRPLGWRFSLGTLLLVSALIVTVISHVRTARRLERLRQESYALEVGLLDRIYVRQLPYTAYDVWQWKVYIPERDRYQVGLATKDIGRTGLPSAQQYRKIEFQGEITITVVKHDVGDFHKSYGVTVRLTHKRSTSQNHSQTVPYSVLGGNSLNTAGQDGTEAFDPKQPVVLLRGEYSRFVDDPPTSGSSSLPPGIGILVWIEPIPVDQRPQPSP